MEELNGGSPLSPASVGGRRRSHKKLRMVKKKTVKRMLKKMGLKMRGGTSGGEVTGDKVVTDPVATGALIQPASGGRRRKGKSHRRSGKSLFGMKF
jgi:hypothetical protein